MRVLILGGTARAREVATVATALGYHVVYSLSGAVTRPLTPRCPVRVGPFPGGLARWCRAWSVDRVVVATHPFATTIADEAYSAALGSGVPTVLSRCPGWRPVPGDEWYWADSPRAAARLAESLGRRILLTTGARSLSAFADSRRWFLIRTIEEVDTGKGAPRDAVFLRARGPFTTAGELALLREHRVDLVVTKDSGAEAVAAKLTAARESGIPVVLVRRPAPPPLPSRDSVSATVDWLAGHRGG